MLKSNFNQELRQNVDIFNKLKGTSVHFDSSKFQLLHVKSLKFLALN